MWKRTSRSKMKKKSKNNRKVPKKRYRRLRKRIRLNLLPRSLKRKNRPFSNLKTWWFKIEKSLSKKSGLRKKRISFCFPINWKNLRPNSDRVWLRNLLRKIRNLSRRLPTLSFWRKSRLKRKFKLKLWPNLNKTKLILLKNYYKKTLNLRFSSKKRYLRL